MTAFEIYSAIGGVNEDILEESEIMPKKKITKIIPLMAAAACFAVFAAGLSHALRNDGIEQPVTGIKETMTLPELPETGADGSYAVTYDITHTEETAVTYPNTPTETIEMFTEPYPAIDNEGIESEMPNPFYVAEGTGGDQYDGFYLPCNYILNSIPGALLDLRDSDEVHKWLEKDKLSSKSEIPTSVNDYVNLYSFITEFNITREEAEEALKYYINDNYITYEHLDIIFSGDIELITKTFANDLSIAVGDRIYSPEWLYMHSPDEYRAAGITAEDILSRVGLYSSIYFTDEARQAFSEKLSAYTGETVVIETVIYEEKDEVPVHEAILEEDTYDDYIEVEEVPEEYE